MPRCPLFFRVRKFVYGGIFMNHCSELPVPCRVDAAAFRRFALFDTFRLQKAWQRPALFVLMMAAFAAVCFIMHDRRGAVLLGCVLLGVGLVLPAGYFLSFYLSVRRQSLPMDGMRVVYTVVLSDAGVQIQQAGAQLDFAWPQIHHAYQAAGCVYLYTQQRQAFLLPAPQGDEAWAVLQSHMDASRLTYLH